ncbi:MAG: hypothetical protein EZS28_043853 [Streblomastix strix]|uniref:Uncharacterized protein n=1 Tax=Streblomastix strix TaxID=222440 RepID=A0A5J4TRM6_9EUKA|nr:MAG: hypothetical protein EZS28_043853 [Streblomastix strix]
METARQYKRNLLKKEKKLNKEISQISKTFNKENKDHEQDPNDNDKSKDDQSIGDQSDSTSSDSSTSSSNDNTNTINPLPYSIVPFIPPSMFRCEYDPVDEYDFHNDVDADDELVRVQKIINRFVERLEVDGISEHFTFS